MISFRQRDLFTRLAGWTIRATGGGGAFCSPSGPLLVWALLGPFFNYSANWQLVINTGTTIVTFLMVFLIQNAQNRESKAIHLKLDELILAVRGRANELIDIEHLTEEQLDLIAERYKQSGRGTPAQAGAVLRTARRRRLSSRRRAGSHHGEVIARGEVEVGGLQLQGKVVVDAVVADLEQEVAGLAAAEGAVHAAIVAFDQVVDRRR